MIETLLKLGLSEKEAKVYLAALELGSAPASKIAQKSGLNRPTTYVILEKLSNQGLVTSYDKGKVQFFTAEDPEQLARLIREQERDLELRANELKEKLPELKALFGKTDRPKVLVYDSVEAASEYFYNKLKRGDDIYGFTNLDLIKKTAAYHEPPEADIRIKRNIRTNIIYTSSAGRDENENSEKELRKAKYIPYESFPFKSVITIAPTEGVVFMRNPGNAIDTMVVIENKDIAESLKAVFDLLWNQN